MASNIPVATPEVAKPFPEIKVGQTLDEYLDSVGKAWHNGNPSLGKKLQDGTYSLPGQILNLKLHSISHSKMERVQKKL
jgi:hypothetical protein